MGQQSSKQRTSISGTTIPDGSNDGRRGMTRALNRIKSLSRGTKPESKKNKPSSRPFSTRLLNLRRRARGPTRTRDMNVTEVVVSSSNRLDEQSIRSEGSDPPTLVPCTEPADGLQHTHRSRENQSRNLDSARFADRSNQSTPSENTYGESGSSRTANETGSNSSNPPEERLQANIDVLASLLSMATAATASSLLNHHADVLTTLSSDSSLGSQLSPQRARVAWSILEHLFHLRSNRRTTSSNNVDLLQDLSLALLTSRIMNVSPLGPPREPTELQPGSFERFLVDVHGRVRTSLQEDHERSASGAEPRRVNWWQAFQFPVVETPRDTRNESGRQAPTNSESLPGSTSDSSTATGDGPQGQADRNLIPVVLVGLRSLAPNPSVSTGTTPVGSPSQNTTTSGQPDTISPEPAVRPPFDDLETITSSYVIIVLGGHYPPGHRYVSATNSEESNELDLLWDLVDLAAAKSPTVTQEELSHSNLRCFPPSQISKMNVAVNTAEKCLICLDDYVEERQLRQMSCMHAFHKDCLDRWLTEGQNGCPMCRQVAVQRTAEEP